MQSEATDAIDTTDATQATAASNGAHAVEQPAVQPPADNVEQD